MISINLATAKDFQLLTALGKASYIESHGSSAKAEDIEKYVSEKYNDDVVMNELKEQKNIYHIVYYNGQPAGYSKIILDEPHPEIGIQNITKLERLYLLQEFYGLKLGYELFRFNAELSRSNGQSGMWLYVWKENDKAVRFYKKAGFKIIGSYDFKITDTHYNPNHLMFLEY